MKVYMWETNKNSKLNLKIHINYQYLSITINKVLCILHYYTAVEV